MEAATVRFRCFALLTRLFILIGIVAGSKMVLEQAVVRQTVAATPDLLPREVSQFRKLETKRRILKLDGHRCVYCDGRATQVHHQ